MDSPDHSPLQLPGGIPLQRLGKQRRNSDHYDHDSVSILLEALGLCSTYLAPPEALLK